MLEMKIDREREQKGSEKESKTERNRRRESVSCCRQKCLKKQVKQKKGRIHQKARSN